MQTKKRNSGNTKGKRSQTVKMETDQDQSPDKIYRRASLKTESNQRAKKDCNRQRNVIINFRVSPKEKKLIEARIAATGLQRQRYFIESCLYQTILIKGSVRAFKAVSGKLEELCRSVQRTENIQEWTPEERETLRIILEIMDKLYSENLELRTKERLE